jgi:hypothetical protein
MSSAINGGYISRDIPWAANNRSFTWNVDEPTTHSIANTTNEWNETYMEPGDWTLWIAVQQEDLDLDSHYWTDHEYQYWTSPRYVVGNNPLPASAADRGIS